MRRGQKKSRRGKSIGESGLALRLKSDSAHSVLGDIGWTKMRRKARQNHPSIRRVPVRMARPKGRSDEDVNYSKFGIRRMIEISTLSLRAPKIANGKGKVSEESGDQGGAREKVGNDYMDRSPRGHM